ncbi:hypothetical protein J6590_041596 [Homalodisca vitripennis]|nr:hypothetical protein J6590_041596 [Homalodisca vitripennis]
MLLIARGKKRFDCVILCGRPDRLKTMKRLPLSEYSVGKIVSFHLPNNSWRQETSSITKGRHVLTSAKIGMAIHAITQGLCRTPNPPKPKFSHCVDRYYVSCELIAQLLTDLHKTR